MSNRKLIRIGKVDVRSAIGFFWHDGYKMYVAEDVEDVTSYENSGFSKSEFHEMHELETFFRNSSALKFISWCKRGCIVKQGARQVTFEYDTQKIVLRIR